MKIKTFLIFTMLLSSMFGFSQEKQKERGVGGIKIDWGLYHKTGTKGEDSQSQKDQKRGDDTPFGKQFGQQNGRGIAAMIKVKETKSGYDSVFYLNIVKRNGWPEGIGKPLKKEELSHIPVYYVL